MPAIPPTTDFPKATITKDTFHSKLLEIHAYLTGLLGSDGVAATARGQLGLGTAATKSAGTTAGTIPLWDYIPLNAVSAKTAGYTVVAADRGKLIDYTSSTSTLAFDAVATLGVFACAVRNSGTGVITLDPNASELIDGVASIDLAAGESCLVVCDGTAWKTVGRTVVPAQVKVSANDTTAGYLNGKLVAGSNITMTEGSDGGNETLTIAATGVSGDLGGQVIGAIIASISFTSSGAGGYIDPGWAVGSDYSYTYVPGASAGTWTCLAHSVGVASEIHIGTFQRIA